MMQHHTVRLSNDRYQALLEQAERLGTTPEAVLDRLLTRDLAALLARDDDDTAELIPSSDPADALAAVRRLTTMFADMARPDLEAVLDDPLLALENVALLDPRP